MTMAADSANYKANLWCGWVLIVIISEQYYLQPFLELWTELVAKEL